MEGKERVQRVLKPQTTSPFLANRSEHNELIPTRA